MSSVYVDRAEQGTNNATALVCIAEQAANDATSLCEGVGTRLI